ncbi:MAG: hypothetical protein IJR22_02960 [Acidaminococcaceae bacterium]|nr:hypothetical protein [Acidaminococcaceae bacterium]
MSEEKIYFPDITAPSWPFDEEPEDTSITSKFEEGSMQSRSKFTRSRRKWTLKWKNIPRKEYLILMHFIKHVVKFSAKSFYWINTDSIDNDYQYLNPYQEEVEVRITNVGKWSNENLHYWSGTLELTEV